MLHKLTSYFLIILLALPSTLFFKPKESDAFIIQAAIYTYRAALLGAKFINARLKTGKELRISLQPWRGKLYEARITNWTPFATASTATSLAALALGASGYFDAQKTSCVLWNASINGLTGSGATAQEAVSSLVVPASWGANVGTPYLGAPYSIAGAAYDPAGYDIWVDAAGSPFFFQSRGVGCAQEGVSDFTALDEYVTIELEPLTPDQQALKVMKVFEDLKTEVLNDPLSNIENSSIDGFSIVEVPSMTYTDSNGVVHNITKDANGNLLDNGQPYPDEMIVVDVNGVVHRFQVDPVTGNILDNTNPVGNFAQWTDAEGNVHTVTVDPLTGNLKDNNVQWNPDTLTPTASNPSGGTVTVDPYTGQTIVDIPALDLTPLLDAQAISILEQKKTTDELLKTNQALKDLYSSSQTTNKNLLDLYSTGERSNQKLDVITQSLKDLYSATTQANNSSSVDTYSNTETRSMSVSGLTGTAQTIIDASPLNTWVDAMSIIPSTSAALPAYTLNLFSLGTYTLDFNDFAYFFDGIGTVVIVIATFFAIRIVFRS